MSYPCVVETRLTFDHGGAVGMHCDYPFGLFTTMMYQGQSVEIDRSRNPIVLKLGSLGHGEGWATLTDVTGEPMTKFRVPESVELGYREYRFYFYGKLYILEFRFDSIGGTEQK